MILLTWCPDLSVAPAEAPDLGILCSLNEALALLLLYASAQKLKLQLGEALFLSELLLTLSLYSPDVKF